MFVYVYTLCVGKIQVGRGSTVGADSITAWSPDAEELFEIHSLSLATGSTGEWTFNTSTPTEPPDTDTGNTETETETLRCSVVI